MGERDFSVEDSLFSEAEFVTGLADLTAQGLIEWGSDTKLRLTSKGIFHGIKLVKEVGSSDWIVLSLLYEKISGIIRPGQE
ncbi:unnamed protein product [marine sediment metagenome]|uniref:Uncharacterized protein n=1 Tax=marine sediment metagenome TaxID=412755 RepID=X1D652_9ZZZZ